jgi:hypothetical protein
VRRGRGSMLNSESSKLNVLRSGRKCGRVQQQPLRATATDTSGDRGAVNKRRGAKNAEGRAGEVGSGFNEDLGALSASCVCPALSYKRPAPSLP